MLLAYWDLPPRASQNSGGSCPSAITGFSILEIMSATVLAISRSSPLQPCQASTAAPALAQAKEEEKEAGTVSWRWQHPCCTVPSSTHLPIPEVTAAGGFEHKDIIGVEGGGTDRHLEGFGVVLVGAMHLEEAGGGCRLCATCPRGATLGDRVRRSLPVPQTHWPAPAPTSLCSPHTPPSCP